MEYLVETNEFKIESYMPWLQVHCRFIPTQVLLDGISLIPGVSRASIDSCDKYCIDVFYGKAFDSEEIAYAVAIKITEYSYKNI